MEPPLLFVFIIAICALIIDCQSQPPPPLSFPPPQSRYGRPPPTHPPPPNHLNSTRPPPPNHLISTRPPPPPPKHKRRAPPPPPPKGHGNKHDVGRKIGLLFVGVAAILQIGVVGFLVFKRNQIMKVKDRFESS